MKDSEKYRGQRAKLMALLYSKGIEDEEVLRAMGRIPRHSFMDSSFESFAYQDKAFPIAAGQTISQPYTVAFQSSLLMPLAGMKVLEIGTGSGYQAAVLAELGAKLYSIERQQELFQITRKRLRDLGYRFYTKFGDGFAGLPTYAPFDRIIVTCGAPAIPKALVDQLANGGVMVIPVGVGQQKMQVLRKAEDGKISLETKGDFRFVPMLNSKQTAG